MTIDEVEKLVIGPFGGFVLAVFVMKFLFKERDQLQKRLTQERDARIALLEQQSSRCAEDRMQLHKEISGLQDKISELQNEIRTLYKSMLVTQRDPTERVI